MRYQVRRTSAYNEKPCSEAFTATVDVWDTKTISEERFDAQSKNSWRSRGTDHKVEENGYISRKIGTEEVWMIVINTLEELQEFIKKYGKVVVNEDGIEIYDGWRE